MQYNVLTNFKEISKQEQPFFVDWRNIFFTLASRLKYLSKMNPKFVKQLKGWLDDGTGRSIAKRQYDGMIL